MVISGQIGINSTVLSNLMGLYTHVEATNAASFEARVQAAVKLGWDALPKAKRVGISEASMKDDFKAKMLGEEKAAKELLEILWFQQPRESQIESLWGSFFNKRKAEYGWNNPDEALMALRAGMTFWFNPAVTIWLLKFGHFIKSERMSGHFKPHSAQVVATQILACVEVLSKGLAALRVPEPEEIKEFRNCVAPKEPTPIDR